MIITPCTSSPDRPLILNKLPEALVQDDWPAVKHASGISSKKKSVLPRQLRTASKKKDYILSSYFKGGTIPKTNEIVTHICSCHNFFSLSSVQIIIIPACCLLCVL